MITSTGSARRCLACVVALAIVCSFVGPQLVPGTARAATEPVRIASQTGVSVSSQSTPTPGPTQLLTLGQLGYADRTVKGSRSTIPVELVLRPGQTVLTSSTFTLNYDLSPAIDPEISSITVSVNGAVRTTSTLESTADGFRTMVVPLQPTDRLPDRASVMLTLEIVLAQAGVACPPAVDPRRWLTIRADSVTSLGLTNADQSVGLSDLASLFSPTTPDPISRTGEPVAIPITIVVGQGAAAEEFQAAGYVATAIGRWAAERNIEPSILFSDQIPPDQPTIVVSAGIRFASSLVWGDVTWDGANYVAPTGFIAANRGFLALQRTAVPRLLVSGATPAGVLDAASALVEPGRAETLTGSYAILTGRDAAIPELRQPTWDHDTATFQGLGAFDQVLAGTGWQSVELTFNRPAGWVITDGARLIVDLAVAGNVSADAAVMLTLNGTVIGSVPIAPGGNGSIVTGEIASTQTVRSAELAIPPNVLNVLAPGQSHRELRLGIVASLGVGATCSGLSAPSVTILAGSRWVLPHAQPATLDLARFPSPLSGGPDSNVAPLMVVMPDWPTTGEQQAALRVIASVARWSAGDHRLLPRLIPIGRLNADDRITANLVVIGTPTRNPLAGEIVGRNALVFGLPSTTSSTANYPQVMGQIALLPSPWKSSGAILLLTSDFEAGVPLAGSNFTSSEQLAGLTGGVVSVGGSTPPQLLAGGEPVVAQQSGVVDRFGWDRWLSVAGIAALVVVLALIGPLLTSRLARTGRDQ